MIDAADPTVYGPIGVLAAAAITACVKLYRDRERDRKAHAAQLLREREEALKLLVQEREGWDEERQQLRDELRTLEERYITKAETWAGQYQEFSKAATAVVDAAMRRYRRDSGGHERTQE